ncbi:MAG: carboxypeptidase M32 [Spirochaetaceae bacterium]|nr:carboxypeptidase M32 [Spirochaetaceae bacterium]
MLNKEIFNKLVDKDKEIVIYKHISAVLEFDLETAGSKSSGEERAIQLALIAQKVHSLETDKNMLSILKELGVSESKKEGFGESDFEKALIKNRYKVYLRNSKIPNEFIGRKEKALSLAYDKWVQARQTENFPLFAPLLKKVVALEREEANFIKEEGQGLYDALLDSYEEGMTSAKLDKMFGELEPKLVEMVKKYSTKSIKDDFLYKNYDKKKQEKFALGILKDMGFDMDRGTLSLAIHPFTSTLGSDDIRITTRYSDPSLIDPLSSTIHEGGHALYEMGASSGEIKGTSLGEGVSMGFHESQSRFYENILLRSPMFWNKYYERLQETFPENLANISKKEFVEAINIVKPSFIRTNADEVTYNLHIILRYILEKKLIEGTLSVDDLPDEWNKLFYKMFNLKVDRIAEGCLQDVHWSSGLFGYFPTYALGNLYSAQIYNQMIEDFGGIVLFEKSFEEKGLLPISEYLNKNIHSKGGLYTPEILIKRITKKALDGNYFTEYLNKKLFTLTN